MTLLMIKTEVESDKSRIAEAVDGKSEFVTFTLHLRNAKIRKDECHLVIYSMSISYLLHVYYMANHGKAQLHYPGIG